MGLSTAERQWRRGFVRTPSWLQWRKDSGALVYELELRQGRYGISSACVGGGQGVALLIKRA